MFWFFGQEACEILSSQIRDQTCTPCIGRWSPNHWTEVHGKCVILIVDFFFLFFCKQWNSFTHSKTFSELPAAAAAKSLQSCPTLCDPIDGSPPGSPVPGILQPRTLEWVAISFSNAWKWKLKVKLLSHVRLLATPWTAAHQAPPSMGFSRQEYWSGVPLPSLQWVAYQVLRAGD